MIKQLAKEEYTPNLYRDFASQDENGLEYNVALTVPESIVGKTLYP